jgi:hypothetical protein
MGRMAQSLGFLCLGALAAGAGTVVVVFKANADRTALVAQAADAREQALQAKQTSQTVVDEANRKVEAASQEVAKAQARIQALEDERRLVATAVPLTKPKAISSWKEYVSMPLGFTIRMPAPTVDPQFTQTSFDAGWLLITKYNGDQVESDQSYLVQNHLLTGNQSTSSWNFIVQSNGEPTLLIRAFPSANMNGKTILDVLSTLTFHDQ